MTTLRIQMAFGEDQADNVVQELKVSHLTARDLSPTELATPRSTTPGVIILLPQTSSFTLEVDSTPILMAPGLGYVLRGTSSRTLSGVPYNEDREMAHGVQMIEVNAVVNGVSPLAELVRVPTQLLPAASEEAERIYNVLTQNRTPLILPAGAGDVMLNMVAAQLVVLLLTAAGSELPREDDLDQDRKLLELKTFMMRNLNANPSVKEMARYLGMSRSAFYRWATPLLGDTPIHYLRKLRLEKSQELLRNTSLSMDEIAIRTGFSSRHHLTKEFVKQYNIPPASLQRAAARKDHDDPTAAVELLIRERAFNKALALCEKNLKRAKFSEFRDQIHDQQARCLYALGKVDEAETIWESLGGSTFSFEAGKQLCNLLFRRGEHERVLTKFTELYPTAGDSEQRELILIWSHHVAELISQRMPGPLSRYLEVRRELFPNNLRSMPLAGNALYGLGQEHLVLMHCRGMALRCLLGLRRAGFYQKGIDEFGAEVEGQVAQTLLLAGRNEEVLAAKDGSPEVIATALTRLGRPDEAIRRYPEHCQEAYYTMGRFEEFLDHWPEPSFMQVKVLHRLNRAEDLLNYPKSDTWLWQLAQFFLGPEHFLALEGVGDSTLYHRALLWQTLIHLSTCNMKSARRCLERIPLVRSPQFWFGDRDSYEMILTTVTRGLCGDYDSMRSELRMIHDQFKYADWQKPWYDAAFLLGALGKKEYRRQPTILDLEMRLALVSALKDDLGENSVESTSAYRRVLAGSLDPTPELMQFLHWRLA